MTALRDWVDRLLGRGASAVTVPTLDGPLLPNQLLEQAAAVATIPEIDNMIRVGSRIVCSCGGALRSIDATQGGDGQLLRRFPGTVTALAATASGALAGAVEGSGIVVSGGGLDERSIATLDGHPAACITAMIWLDRGTLAVAIGASGRPAEAWRRDLMEHGQSGSVWRVDAATGAATCLARGLAWPGGLAATSNGSLYVAEAWRHRIVELKADVLKPVVTVVSDLPAYPGRMIDAAGGGYWLAMPTVRNQLVEFILREPGYLRRMLAEVPEPYWMAPTLASGLSFKEPMQGSQLKQMGILKPWSATRSYGLVVRCDERMQPLRSFHARADGHIHGVTSLCEWDGDLLVGAKGAGEIVRLRGVCAERLKDAAE